MLPDPILIASPPTPGAQLDIQFGLYIESSLRQATLMNFRIHLLRSVDGSTFFVFLQRELFNFSRKMPFTASIFFF